MLKRLFLMLAGAALLLPIGVSAIGLGEIKLNSALDEPLRAEIGLVSVVAEEIDELSVRLAPRDQFERAGIELTKTLQAIQFSTVVGADGKPTIRVTTRDAVREPFLNFLVEVNWPAGRVYREYTLLLDPPVMMRGAPPISQAPTLSEPAAARPPTVSAPASGAAVAAATYGPVQRGETLWLIAERLRPDSSVSVEQVMVALLSANPEAFLRNNINGLRAGVVLRVPSREEMTAFSASEAAAASRQQHADWDSYRDRRAAEAGAAPRTQPAAPAAEKPRAEQAPAEPQLKLVVPERGEEGKPAQAPEGTGDAPSGDLATLQKQLAIANEEAEARRLQNEELRA
ncbi:MAG TPA: FimV/HubP family polar landmark protein, partial [Gammaproteobacteria bacterium]